MPKISTFRTFLDCREPARCPKISQNPFESPFVLHAGNFAAFFTHLYESGKRIHNLKYVYDLEKNQIALGDVKHQEIAKGAWKNKFPSWITEQTPPNPSVTGGAFGIYFNSNKFSILISGSSTYFDERAGFPARRSDSEMGELRSKVASFLKELIESIRIEFLKDYKDNGIIHLEYKLG